MAVKILETMRRKNKKRYLTVFALLLTLLGPLCLAQTDQPAMKESYRSLTLNQPSQEYPQVNSQGYAQFFNEISLSNGERVRIDNSEGGFYSVFMQNDKIQSVHKENPEEVVRLIVTFKDQPLSIYQNRKTLQNTSLALIFASMQESHESFRTSLNTIKQNLSAQMGSDYGFKIKRDYYRALNGVAMECKRGMIGRIRALPMVKHISLDRKIKANLTESVHQIRADIVQDSLGYTGDGVLVGDVDTGIDYNNPALGGGFGSSYRVVGGYDFVNNDSDPMDDNGHGTHVAGIIGANGDTLRGVAPDVKFLAVKVLNADGSGYASDVIAGIEYCLDPDNNPETDDAVDVINMSLGGAPFFDNPQDSAVNNATSAGVLSVVSAGNNGIIGYGTIESPGTSETALTVGACDSVDRIADFSSLGPDPIHSSIKPEVVAPGVRILSTILNNETAIWSGTSMAAPHVTGVAALLKQEHPLWTPEEIKAAIVNTAHSIGDDVSLFARGKGCVDALDAANTMMVVEPGVLSFGMVDLEQDVWKDTVQLTVRNLRSVAQQILISIGKGIPTGATLTFDKTSFFLAAGEEMDIQVILTVPSSVPILPEEPFAYVGNIKVTSDSDSVSVPYSFIKASILVVNFDMPPVSIMLFDRTKKQTIASVSSNLEGTMKYFFTVTQGDLFDILTHMSPGIDDLSAHYIVEHKIDNQIGLTYAFISHEEATINMIDTIYDIHNNAITLDSVSNMQLNLSWSLVGEFGFGFWIFNRQVYISPLDSSFFIVKHITATSTASDAFVLSKSIRGLQNQADIEIATGTENLVGYHMISSYDDPYLEHPAEYRKGNIIGTNILKLTLSTNGWTIFQSKGGTYARDICNIYYNKQGISQEMQNNKYFHSSKWLGIGYYPLYKNGDYYTAGLLRTADFTVKNNGEAVFEQVQVANLEPLNALGGEFSTGYRYKTVKSGDTIKIEQDTQVNYPDFMTYINNGSLFMKWNNDWYDKGNSSGGTKQSNGVNERRDLYNSHWNIPLFSTQVLAHNRVQTNMKPFTTWGQILYNSSYDLKYAMYKFDNMENNTGKLRVLSDARPYKILGQRGQCTTDFEYQIPGSLTDKPIYWSINLLGASVVFPSVNLMQVAVGGRAVDIVRTDQTGIIRFVPFNPDSSNLSVGLSLLLTCGDEIQLPVNYLGGNEYNASIPNNTPTGFIDVVARIEDNQGNKGELTASPGFYFGNITDNIKLDARLRMASYVLNNVESIDMQAGDTLNYTLSYINYGSDTARNILITFPTTPYIKPVGSQSWTIDSLCVDDTLQVPIRLEFLGRQEPSEEHTYFSPSIAWTSGETSYLRTHKVLVDFKNTVLSIPETQNTIPYQFSVSQNYPNPFNPETKIKYTIAKKSLVVLKVYNILGKEVGTLVEENKMPGEYIVTFNGRGLSSGIYFYTLRAGDFIQNKKLIILK